MFFTGLIGQLKPEIFSLLMKLQNKMTTAIKSVGNIEHEVYLLVHTFSNESLPPNIIFLA